MDEEQEEVVHRPYKIMEGDSLRIRRVDIIGKNGEPYTFYSANVLQKNDDAREYFKKELYFRNGIDLADRTKIKIIEMFEKVRNNPRDKYQPIWGLFINEFEIVEEPDYYEEQEKIENYQGSKEETIESIW